MQIAPLPILKGMNMALAGLILGIISAIAYFGLPGIITSIIGLSLSYWAYRKGMGNRRFAIIGIALNLFWLIFGIVGEF